MKKIIIDCKNYRISNPIMLAIKKNSRNVYGLNLLNFIGKLWKKNSFKIEKNGIIYTIVLSKEDAKMLKGKVFWQITKYMKEKLFSSLIKQYC